MAPLMKRTAVLVVISTLFAVQVSHEAVHKVGDSAGWTTNGNIDYKQWAAAKTFQVGDTIIFEYIPQYHNVVRATHAMYRACNVSAPLATYTTGNDSITITAPGHHFFFCGVPGHCQAGQKVDIDVLRDSGMAPNPSALPPPPSVHATKAPGPSASNAEPLKALNSLVGKLGLALVVFVAFVSSDV